MSTSSVTAPLEVRAHPGGLALVPAHTNGDLRTWLTVHRDSLRAAATEHGAVLVRGLGLNDRAYVAAVFDYLATDLMAEREAFAARPLHPEGVYASTTWPANQQMCMHHELSYTTEFPGLMLFACLTAPDTGGATAVADARAVLRALPAELVERFSLDRVNASPAVWNYEKLDHLNGHYIRDLSLDDLAGRLVPFVAAAGFRAEENKLRDVVPLVRERMERLTEASTSTGG